MKVLVADDDAVTRRALRGLLDYLGHETVEACDGPSAWEAIRACDEPSLIILDWMMPGMSGIEICRRLRDGVNKPYQYILMLTARDAMDDLVEGMDAGADDYLRKPFDIRELRVRVRAAERVLSEQDALRARAITDELTGILNRRGIVERLHHELALVARDGRDLSVLIADLDHFKAVNDTYGHPIGDEVLKEVTRRMRVQLRAYDDIGRFGGEEFAVLLPACEEIGAMSVAERIRSSVSSQPVLTSAGPVAVSVSIGIASVDTLDDYEPEHVLARADKALYAAKHCGRNRIEIDKGGINVGCPAERIAS